MRANPPGAGLVTCRIVQVSLKEITEPIINAAKWSYVRQGQLPQFTPIYPLMLQLGKLFPQLKLCMLDIIRYDGIY